MAAAIEQELGLEVELVKGGRGIFEVRLGDRVVARGVVTGLQGDVAECEVWLEKDGQRLLVGQAAAARFQPLYKDAETPEEALDELGSEISAVLPSSRNAGAATIRACSCLTG